MQFQFDSIQDFFMMGGYAFYVWLAYGISIGSVCILIWQSYRQQKQLFQQVKKRLQRSSFTQQHRKETV